MTGHTKKRIHQATREEPRGHSKHRRQKPSSSKKVNIILKNMVGPNDEEKKVRIPADAPVKLLKKKIGELFGLDPEEFQLSHVPGKKGQPGTLQVKQPPKSQVQSSGVSTSSTLAKQSSTQNDEKQPVKIILKSLKGIDSFEKTVNIPDDTPIGVLRLRVAEKFGLDPNEFELNLIRDQL